MRNFLVVLALAVFIYSNSTAQNVKKFVNENLQTKNISYTWKNVKSENNNYSFNLESEVKFSCFAFGVKTEKALCIDFIAEYRTLENNIWTDWQIGEFEYSANETNTGYIWSELFFTQKQVLSSNVEFRIVSAKNISEVKLVAYDVLSDAIKHNSTAQINNQKSINECPEIPSIIGRETWLEPYYGTQTYTPTVINPDHVVIHYGASPDTYTDGAAVVRSYWNYHVNTLGWADIGYNYLTDKYGNIYQGRKNANILGQDVKGAHAGNANNESIGVNFIGNTDVTQPTAVQLQSCYKLLAWWFNSRGYDPTTSDPMTTQNSGVLTIPRISGHKDVNIGGTACPGDVLYAELPNMRVQTKAIIDACSGTVETQVNTTNLWETQDFTSNFTDVASNGIKNRFYQVIDFNGTEWGANTDYGFFADNFTSLTANNWQQVIGTWSASNDVLDQTDEVSSNTILSSALNQNNSDSYLYNFAAIISGSGTNKRAGLHFMCSSPTLTNRGNSYMVYYRTDYARVEIYKVVNDVLQTPTMQDYTMQDDVFYDFKIIYTKSTGEIVVYINNQKVVSWIDSSPYTTGDYISFRTGECTLKVSEIKVYHSRGTSETVTLGDATKEIRYQNTNPNVYSAKIKSIAVDVNDLMSSIYYQNINVDWTNPSNTVVYDGLANEIDVFTTPTSISAKWNISTDINSEIHQYWYSVGTAAGNTDVVSWTNTVDTFFTENSLNLVEDQTYYINVKSENNAGLFSDVTSSDGQILDVINSIKEQYENITIYPNPTNSVVVIKNNLINENFEITNSIGQVVSSGKINSSNFEINISNLGTGVYFLRISNKLIIKKIVKI